MNNRRGTPSGDGRGRGRGDARGARGSGGSRGGSGGLRGGGGPRGGFRGAAERGDAFRSEGRRGAGRPGTAGAGRGRDDERDFRPREGSRSGEGFRGGSSGYEAAPGGSRGRYGRSGDARDGAFRAGRGGLRGGRGDSPRRGRGGSRGDREGSSRDGRDAFRDDRRPSYGGERRPARDRDDRRGPVRADRGGTRERYGRDDAGRDRPARDGGRSGERPPGGYRGRYAGEGAGDKVRTIGGSRGRYGRPEPGRGGAGAGRGVPGRGAGVRREDGAAGRPRTARAGRAGAFKSADQPLRDRDLYPADYTDHRDTTEVPDGVRLQKVLAAAGVAARRACEEMIGEGRVTVDGQVVRRFGARVNPAEQVIHVDGKRIPTAPDLVYFAINKPIGVISTMSDPEGRPSLAEYVEERTERLFHVGRLDTETEGLIILTNDGELAHKLTHPSFGVRKKYWAKVPGPIPRDLGRRLRNGVELEDGLAKADDFKIVQEHGQQALVEIVLHEGRKHIVRRMLEVTGHPVIDLARIEFGPVKLGRLKPGTMRSLSLREVGDLYAAVEM